MIKDPIIGQRWALCNYQNMKQYLVAEVSNCVLPDCLMKVIQINSANCWWDLNEVIYESVGTTSDWQLLPGQDKIK